MLNNLINYWFVLYPWDKPLHAFNHALYTFVLTYLNLFDNVLITFPLHIPNSQNNKKYFILHINLFIANQQGCDVYVINT